MSFLVSSTDFADCTTGDVRFINFTDALQENSRQGTLQICVNNAWGTVCSDNYFDTTDAKVFCEGLQGFTRSGQLLRLSMSNVYTLNFKVLTYH